MRRFTFCFGVFLAIAFVVGIVGAVQQGDFYRVVKGGVTSLVPSYPIEQATLNSPNIASLSTSGEKISGASISGSTMSGTNTNSGTISGGSITGSTLNGAGANNSIGLLNAQPPGATLTGNSTDQTVFTYTLPANTLGPGRCLKVTWYVQHIAGTASTAIKLFLGTDLLANNSHSALNATVRQSVFVCNNPGVQNAQFLQTEDRESNSGTVLFQNGPDAQNTVNSLVIKGTFNVANTDQWQGKFFTVELVQ